MLISVLNASGQTQRFDVGHQIGEEKQKAIQEGGKMPDGPEESSLCRERAN